MRKLPLNKNWTITGFSFLLLGLFAYLTHYLMGQPPSHVLSLDFTVMDFAKSLRTPGRTSYFLELTALGGGPALGTLTLAILAFLGCAQLWRRFCQLLLVGLATPFLSSSLKNFAGRERPPLVDRLDTVSSFTFPSGHSLAAASIYLTFAFLLLPAIKTGQRQLFFLGCAGLFVLLIGLSRIYLGVHYLSDVCGGFFLGTGFACLSHIGFNTFWRQSKELEKLEHAR